MAGEDKRSGWSKAWDQVNLWDNGRTWKNPNPTIPQPPTPPGDLSGWPKENTGQVTQQPTNWDDMLKAIRASQPPTPRIANWDYSANWNNAMSRGMAEAQTLYDAKIKNLAKEVDAARRQAQGKFDIANTDIQFSLGNTLQDNQVNRTRTTEDVNQAVQNINKAEGIYQQDEGQAFDQNYRQVAEQLAASGAANTGLGQQQTADMIRLRNVQNQRQLDEFVGQREAKELFKTRTFEDLARGDQRAQQLAANQTKAAQFDLDSALEDIVINEGNQKFVFEMERGTNATERAGSIYDQMVNEWLAGLSGQGYSANDIATTASIYKR